MTSEMTIIIRAIFGIDLSSKVFWIFVGVNIVNDLTICSTLPYRFGDVCDGGDRKRAKLIFFFPKCDCVSLRVGIGFSDVVLAVPIET